MNEKGKLNGRDAKCPFFHAHGKDFIICEGVVPDTECRIDFLTPPPRRRPDEAAKKLHYCVFCCGKWRNCEQAEAIKRSKYSENE